MKAVGAFVGGVAGLVVGFFGAYALLIYVLDPTGHGLLNSTIYIYILIAGAVVGLVIGSVFGYQIGETIENKYNPRHKKAFIGAGIGAFILLSAGFIFFLFYMFDLFIYF